MMKCIFCNKWPIIIVFFACFFSIGCTREANLDQHEIDRKCAEIQMACDPTCLEQRLKVCYVDPEIYGPGPYNVFKNCHAIHVGNNCPPCSHTFSLNFGGAMRSVSCQEFFRAIARKNNECGSCLKKIGEGVN